MPAVELAPIHFDFEPPKDREIQSECGLGAVILTRAGIEAGLNVRKILYQMGMDLQHRAQGSAGMMISDGRRFEAVKDFGWVSSAFKQGSRLPQIKKGILFFSRPVEAYLGMLHTRYPTSGGSNHRENIQPFKKDGMWFGHHGNLTNMDEVKAGVPPEGPLAEFLRKLKKEKLPDSDSWFALNAIAKTKEKSLTEKLLNAQKKFEGGWAFILTDGEVIIASRDPYGIRPLMLGYIGPEDKPWGYAVAVETSAFKKIKGYRGYRDIEPGETVMVSQKGEVMLDRSPKGRKACAFEHVYLHSVVSEFEGIPIYEARKNMGRILWEEQPMGLEDMDDVIVVPVPDSGRPAATGYVEEGQKILGSRIRIAEAMIKNRYVGRVYIEPSKNRLDTRDRYDILRELVEGKRVVVVDDSIVRATTARAYVQMFRENGAGEVHLRIASPPIVWASQYGVDQSGVLFAKEIPNLRDREISLGVDSLGHLSRGGLARAIGRPEEELCLRCFGGDGPPLPKSVISLNEALTKVA